MGVQILVGQGAGYADGGLLIPIKTFCKNGKNMTGEDTGVLAADIVNTKQINLVISIIWGKSTGETYFWTEEQKKVVH